MVYSRASNNVVSNKGDIPWSIEGWLSKYRSMMTNHVIVLGRRTWKQLRANLPYNSKLVVISRDCLHVGIEIAISGGHCCYSPDSALKTAIELAGPDLDVWIIGGVETFHSLETLSDEIHETVIQNSKIDGDKFYRHQVKGTLISSEKTTAKINGEIFEAVSKVWKVIH